MTAKTGREVGSAATSRHRARDPQRTRTAILAAARRRFAEAGYEGATVRDIAADAGIDPALVIRYFGSKDELFSLAARVDLVIPDLAGVDRGEVGRLLARMFVERWRDPETLPIILLGARARHPTSDLIQVAYRDQLAAVAASHGHEDALERASLAGSHILGLALGRYLLFEELERMADDDLVDALGPVLQHYLVEDW